ncbi:MAG TPA: hypothetical protein VHE35_24330 [Kofleriaceae bacterium]|nr:hypothetical protein [Kofleriaceae bacterium]
MTRRAALALLALLFLVVGTGCSRAHTDAPARKSPLGTWREFWGVPGETDVDYHDEYQVGASGGKVFVVPMGASHSDEVKSVSIDGDDFDLVLHTSFDVHYKLHLDAGGDSMTGTATTPDKTVPIRWERMGNM